MSEEEIKAADYQMKAAAYRFINIAQWMIKVLLPAMLPMVQS